jgi:hypothetical protein
MRFKLISKEINNFMNKMPMDVGSLVFILNLILLSLLFKI